MTYFINILYIISAVLFIFGIKMLGRADSAKRGNLISAIGMLLAIVATLVRGNFPPLIIISGLIIGAVIGAFFAQKVPMTGMPQMVAMFNGFGGLASLLVAWAEQAKISRAGSWSTYLEVIESGGAPRQFTMLAIALTALIGGVTFTGSIIAYLRLSGKMSGSATVFRSQLAINVSSMVVSLILVAAVALLPINSRAAIIFYVLIALALWIGVAGALPIGGGDMPVVIALLNSFSGLAACAAGFVINNTVLIVAGCIVGASGLILTIIMCKAMNRSLGNVIFSGFGSKTEISAGQEVEGEMKAMSPEDAYYVLEAASSVVFVPGYGMAVAQAQHVVKELGSLLEKNGAEVRFAIHPVAGRMPGHMNVLLAEADVPYEQLNEMDEVNAIIDNVDVAVVIGANDVVNPAAAIDESSPIYGMPIINVHQAHNVFVLKRGQGKGFSGLINTLFYRENTRMIYGDAKDTITNIVSQFED